MKTIGPTLTEQIAEKYACAVNIGDGLHFIVPSAEMLSRPGVKFDQLVILGAIREYSQRKTEEIRAEATKWSGGGRDVDKSYVRGLRDAARILEQEGGTSK